MQIVIEIDDNLYSQIKYLEPKANTMLDKLMRSIQNGTPLPKGHDRLVEVRAIVKALFAKKTIDDVQTIIEADNAESEE